MDKVWTKEDVYDEQISPLMSQIIAICKEHKIPMVAQFNYAHDAEDGPKMCTTILPAITFERDDEGQMGRMAKAARAASPMLAFTITASPKEP